MAGLLNVTSSVFIIKILINLLSSSIVLIVYFLALRISKNSTYSLYSAFISGFVPVLYANTYNHFEPLLLTLPLFFLLVYSFIELGKWSYAYIVLLIMLTFTSPIILVFVLGLCLYLVIVYLEKLKQSINELEISALSFFLVIGVLFLFYRNALLTNGISVFWANIPTEILALFFQNITIEKALYSIGFI
ncbi:hypothetical protein ACFLZN_02740, partial [Nanoarchaeota archaeon]